MACTWGKSRTTEAISSISDSLKTLPVGLCGLLRIKTFVLGVILDLRRGQGAKKVRFHSMCGGKMIFVETSCAACACARNVAAISD
jgi:hypothetical protein